MATTTLRPSGDGTTTGWTRVAASGTFASKIVEAVSSNDGDTSYIQSPNVTTSSIFFDLDNPPGDFDPNAISAITINLAHRRLNTPQMTADSGTITARLVKSDETTAMTTTPTAIDCPIQGTYAQNGFTPSLSGTPSLSDWQGARLQITFTHTAQQTIDTVNQIRVSAAEVVVTYTPAGTGGPSPHYVRGALHGGFVIPRGGLC